METMTEEEAFALDEYYTNNPPKVDPAKARIRIPKEILGSPVREQIALQSTT